MNSTTLSHKSKLYFYATIMFMVLLLFWKTTYAYSCIALFVPFVILCLISWSYIDVRMNQKYCFRNCYVENNSKISKFLISPIFVIVFYVLLSMGMTLSLVYAILSYPFFLWIYFLVHFFIVVSFYEKIVRWLSGSIKKEFTYIFARGITTFLGSLLFFIIYIYIFINSYEPSYLRETLDETLLLATKSIESSCSWIDLVLRLYREIDGMHWWLTSSSSETIENDSMRSILWISFVIINGLAVIGINRLLVQIVHVINHFIKKEENVS